MQGIATYSLLLILLLLGEVPAHAQQMQKDAGHTTSRRDAKMEMSSPGDVNFKSYAKLRKSDLITRGPGQGRQYVKTSKTIRVPSRQLKRQNY